MIIIQLINAFDTTNGLSVWTIYKVIHIRLLLFVHCTKNNQWLLLYLFQIHISLVNGRPGAANFSYSKALQVSLDAYTCTSPVLKWEIHEYSTHRDAISWFFLRSNTCTCKKNGCIKLHTVKFCLIWTQDNVANQDSWQPRWILMTWFSSDFLHF